MSGLALLGRGSPHTLTIGDIVAEVRSALALVYVKYRLLTPGAQEGLPWFRRFVAEVSPKVSKRLEDLLVRSRKVDMWALWMMVWILEGSRAVRSSFFLFADSTVSTAADQVLPLQDTNGDEWNEVCSRLSFECSAEAGKRLQALYDDTLSRAEERFYRVWCRVLVRSATGVEQLPINAESD